MIGRGSRPYQGKEFFRVIDMGGNFHRMGGIEFAPPAQIEKKKKGGHPSEILKKCENCDLKYNLFSFGRKCPQCGHIHPRKGPEQVHTALSEQYAFHDFMNEKLRLLLAGGYKTGWLWRELRDDAGYSVAVEHVPEGVSIEELLQKFCPEKATPEELRKYERNKLIKKKREENYVKYKNQEKRWFPRAS